MHQKEGCTYSCELFIQICKVGHLADSQEQSLGCLCVIVWSQSTPGSSSEGTRFRVEYSYYKTVDNIQAFSHRWAIRGILLYVQWGAVESW